MGRIVLCDCIDCLAGFLEESRAERKRRLLLIPRAAFADSLYDFKKFFECVVFLFHVYFSTIFFLLQPCKILFGSVDRSSLQNISFTGTNSCERIIFSSAVKLEST